MLDAVMFTFVLASAITFLTIEVLDRWMRDDKDNIRLEHGSRRGLMLR